MNDLNVFVDDDGIDLKTRLVDDVGVGTTPPEESTTTPNVEGSDEEISQIEK